MTFASFAITALFFISSSRAADPVGIVAASENPKSFVNGSETTFTYTIENLGGTRMTLSPQLSSVDKKNECRIIDSGGAPIEPGKSGKLTVRCGRMLFGNESGTRSFKLEFEAIPYGIRSLKWQGRVYSPLDATNEVDTCSQRKKLKCFGPREKIRVCFRGKTFGKGLDEVWFPEYVKKSDCGPKSRVFEVNSVDEVVENLRKIRDEECGLIEDIVISDHGSTGDQKLQKQHLLISDFKKMSLNQTLECAFTKDIHIRLNGCGVGQGCAGSVYLASIANVFSSKGPLKISSPTYYSVSGLENATSDNGSLNGKDLVVKKESWGLETTFEGLLVKDGVKTGLPEICRSDCGIELKRLRKLKDFRKTIKCPSDIVVALEPTFALVEDTLKRCVLAAKPGFTDSEFYYAGRLKAEDLNYAFQYVRWYDEYMTDNCSAKSVSDAKSKCSTVGECSTTPSGPGAKFEKDLSRKIVPAK